MMNMFPGMEFPTEMLFHDPSVFSDNFAIDLDGFVSMVGLVEGFKSKVIIFWKKIFRQATPRAVSRYASFQSILGYVETFRANFTGKLGPIFLWGFSCSTCFFNRPFFLTWASAKSYSVFVGNKNSITC